jgi:predicted ATPase
LEDRIVADLALGRHAAAVPELEALVVEHPLRERLWALLMVSLYRCGRQGEALRAYQTARKLLAEQLGGDPGAELRHLEAQVLAQAASLEWQPPAERAEGSAPAPPPVPTRPRPADPDRPPLVGRDTQLARLTGALEEALAGRGGVVLVFGEPGIGKTRLAQEVTARAVARGAEVAWGGTHEEGGAPAFWPWVQLLRPLVLSADPEELGESLGAAGGEVAQILPEVKERLPALGAPPSLDPETARFRLYEGVCAFLLHRATRSPLLLVLDDLHWADTGSLQLLGFLSPRLRTAPILIVATYRPLDVDSAHPLVDTLAALARDGVAERVVLRGLERKQVGELIAATTGATPSPGVLAVVHNRTEGNPFYVSELARLMVSEHTLDETAAASLSGSIPAGVGDVIRRRLGRLPEKTNALIVLAAVLGREFELRELATTALLDLDAVIEHLEPAVLTGVVVEDRHVVGRLRFSHALVQETVYTGLTTVRRARLHAKVGRALEDLYGPDDDEHVPELARHFSHAAHIGEAARAWQYAIRAADLSTARFAYDQAEVHLIRALEALARLPAGPERDRRELDVYSRRAIVLALTRGYASSEAGEAGTRAHHLASRLGDTDHLSASLWSLWGLSVVRAQFDPAVAFGRQLLELGEKTGEARPLVGGHQALGSTAVHRGELALGREHLERAIALADSLDDPSLADVFFQHPSVFSRGFAAVAAWLLGDAREAVTLSTEAIRLARRLAHPFTLTLALFFDAWLGVFEGDPDHVRGQASRAVELSEDHGFALFSAMGSALRGWARARQGDADGGCVELADALDRIEATSARMLRHFFLGLLADAHRHADRHKEALAVLSLALAEADAVGERFYEAELHRLRAVLAAEAEPTRSAEARESLARSLAVARAQRARALERRVEDSLRRLGA